MEQSVDRFEVEAEEQLTHLDLNDRFYPREAREWILNDGSLAGPAGSWIVMDRWNAWPLLRDGDPDRPLVYLDQSDAQMDAVLWSKRWREALARKLADIVGIKTEARNDETS